MIIPVILSGGSGTRLWPLSTRELPKQFLPLVGDRSLFQETLLRLKGIPDLAEPVVVCNESHRFVVAEQLREIAARAEAILLEPEGRNTAPAIAMAALLAMETSSKPESSEPPILLVLPADHVIADAAAFRSAVAIAVDAAKAGRLATFGIVPTSPETGYDYIEQGGDGDGWRPVARFVEKPDRATAERYLASGRFLWNSGMFVLGAEAALDEILHCAPTIHMACRAATETMIRDGEFFRPGGEFLACPSDSFDYAVMEKTGRAVVVPLAAGWSDVGSWSALHAALSRDDDGNVVRGQVTTLDAHGCLAIAGSRRVALLGVDDLVVIDAKEAILIAHKDRAQAIKELLRQLEQEQDQS